MYQTLYGLISFLFNRKSNVTRCTTSINSCPALVRSCLSEARAQALVPQWVLRPFWAHERSKPGARYATRCFSESCLSESCLSGASSGTTLIDAVGIFMIISQFHGVSQLQFSSSKLERHFSAFHLQSSNRGGDHRSTTNTQRFRLCLIKYLLLCLWCATGASIPPGSWRHPPGSWKNPPWVKFSHPQALKPPSPKWRHLPPPPPPWLDAPDVLS